MSVHGKKRSRIRLILWGVTLLLVALAAWWIYALVRHINAVRFLERYGGVGYDYQVNSAGEVDWDTKPTDALWLRKKLPRNMYDALFHDVVEFLFFSELDSDDFADLEALERLRGIESVTLIFSGLRADQVELLCSFDAVVRAGSIELRMNHDPPLTDAHLARISSLGNVTVLGASFSGVTDEGLRYLVTMKSLRELGLDWSQIGDAGLESLSSLASLEVLTLGQTKVTDEGVRHLRALVSLRVAVINDTRITDDGVRELARLKNLHWLDLSGTRIRGPGLMHLVGHPKLRLFDVGRTQINDDAMSYLERMTDLEELWLNGCRISDDGLKRLHSHSGLKKLDVSKTNVSADGVRWLQSRLPTLIIESDYPSDDDSTDAAP